MGNRYADIVFKGSAAHSCTGAALTVNHTGLDCWDAKQMVVLFQATSLLGTTPGVTVKFQGYIGGTYKDMPIVNTGPRNFAFAAVTTAASQIMQLEGPFPEKMRCVSTLLDWTRITHSVKGTKIYEVP